MKTAIIGSAHANVWLHDLGHELPEEIIILPEMGPKRAQQTGKPARVTHPMDQILEAYPNPATTTQWLVYQLPDGAEQASLLVRDLLGRKQAEVRLGQATGIAELAVQTWPNGLYTATLSADGIPVGTVKLMVQR